jgi:glycosyltransferase involved in cell wall biosynthesis
VKILITTVFFPPQNAIASQRPYSWARAWAAAGHEVTVLTIDKDLSKSDLAPMPMEGFRTIEVSGGPIIGRLRESRKASSADAAVRGQLRRSTLGPWLRRRGFLSSVRWPDIFDFWVPRAARAIPDDSFDLIISTFGPPASLAIGYRAKKLNPGAKWVCDFRDLWSDNHVYPGFWPFTVFERFAESKYLDASDGVTTVSEALARALRDKVADPAKVAVFENGFQPREVAGLDAAPVFEDAAKIRLVYTGSLHPKQRNPEPLLEALARLSHEDRKRFEIIFAGPRESFLEDAVARFGVGDVVRALGSRPRQESLRFQRDADILLFFETQHAAERDGVLTGKLFEYLATGRPIWAIGIDSNSTVGSMIESSQAGRAFGPNVDQILFALRTLLAHGRADRRDISREQDVVHRYDRTLIAERLLRWVQTEVHHMSS